MSYYAMHRGWMEHPAFGNRKREPYCRAAAWCWLIEHAQFEPTQAWIGGKAVELQRGQLSHSLRFLAQAWGWQHDRCRRFVAELSQLGMTATDTATGQLIITICNYDKYQMPPQEHATASATVMRRSRDSGATNTNKEIREEDTQGASAPWDRSAPAARANAKEGRSYGPESRKTPIAADWEPDLADCQYAAGRGWDARRIGEQADAFADRCRRDRPLFADWHAAWRTWVRKADEFAANSHRPNGQAANGHAAARSGSFATAARNVAARLDLGGE